jgi:hypothetical protein
MEYGRPISAFQRMILVANGAALAVRVVIHSTVRRQICLGLCILKLVAVNMSVMLILCC